MPDLRFDTFNQPVHLTEVMTMSRSLSDQRAQKAVLFVLSGLLFAGLLLGILIVMASGSWLFFVFFCVIPAFLMTLATLAMLKNIRRAVRLQRFAAANGFAFSATQPTEAYPGVVFTVGDKRQFITVVKGAYHGLPFEFGNFFCTIGSGRNKRQRAFGVVEMRLTRKLPHILLDSLKNNPFGFSNLPMFHDNQQLTLEGNFNRYFALYVPKGYERDALYFITPELMALLIDLGAEFDIEIIDDRLYIYKNTEFTLQKQSTLEQIFKLVKVLGAEVQENTHRYADANTGDRAANAVAEPGRRLKRPSIWLGIVFLTLFMLLMMALGIWIEK